ncbi:Thioredoxin family protein [Candida parapsilosis]|uniref:Thioredoxin domain-containing protein n=2 Tax=Candida parapsilosis TaxID=5480 RepID=G8B6D1_CANPC|nr:uncharacterized protein CPAR2_100510 [Candida parapsilosis]KAF6047992.1 Thioredoxin family protein [Candida parapsilosis]KAF6050041.1 Thioredoxin family protein [Candida parapsilosis]KAF6057904.1 Thioredoxin family protein [Candida parapsilosis]KAF6065389.1 Thioredoxin family protein [Candida parapsilosis]KAI5903775.1 Thioredoxin-2 [Candida parapsilosis]
MLQDIKTKQQLANALQSQYQSSETTSRRTETGVDPGTSSRTKIQSKAMNMASNMGFGSGSGSNASSHEDHVIVVDFFDDCDHCLQMNSKLDEYSNWYQNNSKPVDFYKVNIEDKESKSFASDYSVDSIPTTLFFKKGKLVDKVVGAQPAQIKKVLDDDLL